MGDNSLYHVLALISKNHKYNKMKSSFIYLLFLEESHNPLRIKSLCGSSKNEVTSWQPFWFLHTCINCVDVQLTLCKGTIFYGTCKTPLIFLFSNRQKQSFGFISRSQRRYSLFMKSKQRSGRIETDCYENSQKRIAYRNYSLIPGRGRLCAKVQKEVLFPDGKLPHL